MKDERQTLVILTPAFAADEADSWLPSQESLIRAINKNFPELSITILSFHFPQPKRTYTWHGNEVITLGFGMKTGFSTALRWLQAWRVLKGIHSKKEVLGIFSFFCSESAFIGHYFAKRHSLKHHIWVLGQDAKAANRQVKRIKPEPDELVCISDFLVCEFEQNHGVKPAHVIPLGIEENLFQTHISKRDIDVFAAGSLIPLKQYDLFVEAVARIGKLLPNISAMHCGDGPEADRLAMLIRECDLEEKLTMEGRKTHSEVQRLMQRSKIFLHTSSYEGFGAVCLEALAAGVHVISFCKPMDATIPHWHIVASLDEMIALAIQLLQDEQTDYTPILPFPIEKSAMAIMQLFGLNKAAL